MNYSLSANDVRAFLKRGLVTLIAVVVMASGLNFAHATTASAATPWSVRLPAPSPASSAWSFVATASCTTSTLCVVGGYYVDSNNVEHGYASIYDGATWTQYDVGNTLNTDPNQVGGTEVSAVNCYSATFCVASGRFTITNQIHGMISIFNGTTWTDYSVGSGIEDLGHGSWINGVSCMSTTLCVAAGTYPDTSYNRRNYYATWNGTSWTTSLFTGSGSDALAGGYSSVSCVSTTFCIVSAGGAVATYNGSTWSYTTIASGASASRLKCLSTTFCALATSKTGYISNIYQTEVKVHFFNGTSWTTTAPTPPGQTPTTIGGLTCVTTTFCVVTGEDSSWHAYASVWNGSSWTKTSVGASMNVGNNAQLMNVSCASTTNCYAAGYYSKNNGAGQANSAFYAKYNGSTWTATDLADVNDYRASAQGAACESSGFCLIYGSMYFTTIDRFHAYVYGSFPPAATSAPMATRATSGDGAASLTWKAPFSNGSAITGYTVTASPGGATCTTTTALTCTISGLTNDTSYSLSVTATNGIGTSAASAPLSATPAAPPVPAVGWTDLADPVGNGDANYMRVIECLSATFCVAGGAQLVGSTFQAAVFVYDGMTWTSEILARSLNFSNAAVTALHCVSTTFCVAGGYHTDSAGKSRAFVASYNGTTWTTTQILSTFTGGPRTQVTAISCASATFCALTGWAMSSSYQPQGFVATFNGVTWTAVAAPEISGSSDGNTFGLDVDCLSTSVCIALTRAVGLAGQSVQYKNYSMKFNGTSWTTTEITQSGFSEIALLALDCLSSTFCAATGQQSISTTAKPVAATYDGTSWTLADTELPGTTSQGIWSVGGINCFSSTNCIAVGTANFSQGIVQSSHQYSLAYDGTAWTAALLGATIDPGNRGISTGLSCPSATLCFASGLNALSDGSRYATMSTWKNGTWTTGALASTLTGSDSNAFGVACPTTTMCIAIGHIQLTPTSSAGFISYFTGGAVKPGSVTGVAASGANASITVTWNAPTSGDAPTSYAVSVASQTSCTVDVAANPSAALSCTFTGLTNGTTYTATVVATNAKGSATGVSASATPVAVPGVPTGITATAGNGSVAVSWTVPTSNGGSAITSYTVTASPSGKTCTVNAPATNCTITGLTNGTDYSFTVSATNAIGNSLASAIVTTAPQAGAPGAPTNVVAAGNDGQAVITWVAPTDDGGAPIDGYIVTASPGGATCTAVAPATTCTITGLANGTSFTFTAVATNNAGNSISSGPSNAVTPGAAPGQPDYLQATPGNGSIQIKWNAPSTGPTPTRYVVTLSPSGRTCTVDLVANPSASLVCNFDGLINGQAYTFTVTAYLPNGNSTSDTISVAPKAAPTKPSVPRLVVFHGSPTGVAVVTWKVSASNGGSPITKYVVFVNGTRYAKSCTVNMATNPRAALQCTFTGLMAKRYYNYRVVAVNALGQAMTPKAKRAIDTVIRMVSFARGKVTMWSGLNRQAFITASYIKRFKYTNIVLTGYTNPGGTLSGRTSFTQARALTVANYLTRQLRALGVTGVTITANGTGASLYSNPNPKQRRLNRSVATLLTYN